MNNKGVTYVIVTILMSIVLSILIVFYGMGINDLSLSKQINDKTKAYYLAEAGVYYGGSIVLSAVNSGLEPDVNETVNKPFAEYKKSHSFQITLTKEGSDYRVVSEGNYDGKTNKVEALITISGGNIVYAQMRKIG